MSTSPTPTSGDRTSPLSTGFRRPDPPARTYVPPTSSPLSPFSPASPTVQTATPLTVRTPLHPAYPSSHYYRPPRSAISSPTRSNWSSPSVSPTRTSRAARIQALLATDPLLARLTPVTITRLSNSNELNFTIAEKEWSLRAAEGISRVADWLREVEGWNLTWPRGRDGDGYLPLEPGRRAKRRKLNAGESGMHPIAEEDEGPATPKDGTVRRKLFASDDSSESNGDSRMSPKSRNGVRSPTSLQSEWKARSEEEEERNRAAEEDEDEEEYWGCLPVSTVHKYEKRIIEIKMGIVELDIDGLKGKVLAYRTGIDNPLTDSSAIITATTLQLLPPLHRLTKYLSIWAMRLAVLRIVPVFMEWLEEAKIALDTGWNVLKNPPIGSGEQALEEDTFNAMNDAIDQKVVMAGQTMDRMLDTLEGREDVLPDRWIGDMEQVEEGFANWQMEAERMVLEGRFRDEYRNREAQSRREMERTKLVLEHEEASERARQDNINIENIMEKAGDLDRELREAMETHEQLQDDIELGDEPEDLNGYEDRSAEVGLGIDERIMSPLASRLEAVQADELEEERGRRWMRDGSVAPSETSDAAPSDTETEFLTPMMSPNLEAKGRRDVLEIAALEDARRLADAARREFQAEPVGLQREQSEEPIPVETVDHTASITDVGPNDITRPSTASTTVPTARSDHDRLPETPAETPTVTKPSSPVPSPSVQKEVHSPERPQTPEIAPLPTTPQEDSSESEATEDGKDFVSIPSAPVSRVDTPLPVVEKKESRTDVRIDAQRPGIQSGRDRDSSAAPEKALALSDDSSGSEGEEEIAAPSISTVDEDPSPQPELETESNEVASVVPETLPKEQEELVITSPSVASETESAAAPVEGERSNEGTVIKSSQHLPTPIESEPEAFKDARLIPEKLAEVQKEPAVALPSIESQESASESGDDNESSKETMIESTLRQPTSPTKDEVAKDVSAVVPITRAEQHAVSPPQVESREDSATEPEDEHFSSQEETTHVPRKSASSEAMKDASEIVPITHAEQRAVPSPEVELLADSAAASEDEDDGSDEETTIKSVPRESAPSLPKVQPVEDAPEEPAQQQLMVSRTFPEVASVEDSESGSEEEMTIESALRQPAPVIPKREATDDVLQEQQRDVVITSPHIWPREKSMARSEEGGESSDEETTVESAPSRPAPTASEKIPQEPTEKQRDILAALPVVQASDAESLEEDESSDEGRIIESAPQPTSRVSEPEVSNVVPAPVEKQVKQQKEMVPAAPIVEVPDESATESEEEDESDEEVSITDTKISLPPILEPEKRAPSPPGIDGNTSPLSSDNGEEEKVPLPVIEASNEVEHESTTSPSDDRLAPAKDKFDEVSTLEPDVKRGRALPERELPVPKANGHAIVNEDKSHSHHTTNDSLSGPPTSEVNGKTNAAVLPTAEEESVSEEGEASSDEDEEIVYSSPARRTGAPAVVATTPSSPAREAEKENTEDVLFETGVKLPEVAERTAPITSPAIVQEKSGEEVDSKRHIPVEVSENLAPVIAASAQNTREEQSSGSSEDESAESEASSDEESSELGDVRTVERPPDAHATAALPAPVELPVSTPISPSVDESLAQSIRTNGDEKGDNSVPLTETEQKAPETSVTAPVEVKTAVIPTKSDQSQVKDDSSDAESVDREADESSSEEESGDDQVTPVVAAPVHAKAPVTTKAEPNPVAASVSDSNVTAQSKSPDRNGTKPASLPDIEQDNAQDDLEDGTSSEESEEDEDSPAVASSVTAKSPVAESPEPSPTTSPVVNSTTDIPATIDRNGTNPIMKRPSMLHIQSTITERDEEDESDGVVLNDLSESEEEESGAASNEETGKETPEEAMKQPSVSPTSPVQSIQPLPTKASLPKAARIPQSDVEKSPSDIPSVAPSSPLDKTVAPSDFLQADKPLPSVTVVSPGKGKKVESVDQSSSETSPSLEKSSPSSDAEGSPSPDDDLSPFDLRGEELASAISDQDDEADDMQPLATSTPNVSTRRLSFPPELPSIAETPISEVEETFEEDDTKPEDTFGITSRDGSVAYRSKQNSVKTMLPDELLGSPERGAEKEPVPVKSSLRLKPRQLALEQLFAKPEPSQEEVGDDSQFDITPVHEQPTFRRSKPSPPKKVETPVQRHTSTPQLPLERGSKATRADRTTPQHDPTEDRRWLREDTPEMPSSPGLLSAPSLKVAKRTNKASLPENYRSAATPDKSKRQFQESSDKEGESSRARQETPELEKRKSASGDLLDDRVNSILDSLPSAIKLTASNLKKLNDSSKKATPLRSWESPASSIPAPRSLASDSPSTMSNIPSYARPTTSARRHQPSIQGDIKLYHLHRTDGQAPIKLYIRLVGPTGERVMVRTGGGWSDLEEYLKEYARHHGSKRRVVSETSRVEIKDIPSNNPPRTLQPKASNSSLGYRRSPTPSSFYRSPSPMLSRPASPAMSSTSGAWGTNHGRSSPAFRSASPMLDNTRRSASPALKPSPIMRGGHNGTRPSTASTSNTSAPPTRVAPSTPPTSHTSPRRHTATPPSGGHYSPPSPRPGSSSSNMGLRRPTSRLSFTESAFDFTSEDFGTLNYSPPEPPKPLGLAGPRSKKTNISPENQAWVEGMLGQVRKASAERGARSAAGSVGRPPSSLGLGGGDWEGGSAISNEGIPGGSRSRRESLAGAGAGEKQRRESLAAPAPPHGEKGRREALAPSLLDKGRRESGAVTADKGRRETLAPSVLDKGRRESVAATADKGRRESAPIEKGRRESGASTPAGERGGSLGRASGSGVVGEIGKVHGTRRVFIKK